jgi:hypothetical protein
MQFFGLNATFLATLFFFSLGKDSGTLIFYSRSLKPITTKLAIFDFIVYLDRQNFGIL